MNQHSVDESDLDAWLDTLRQNANSMTDSKHDDTKHENGGALWAALYNAIVKLPATQVSKYDSLIPPR